jgi:hypothetical protein
MKLFALVIDELVINVSVADDEWTGENWIKVKDESNCGIGYTYDPIDDAFIAPQPYPSWILDIKKQWVAPKPMPVEDGKLFAWNEDLGEWYEAHII